MVTMRPCIASEGLMGFMLKILAIPNNDPSYQTVSVGKTNAIFT